MKLPDISQGMTIKFRREFDSTKIKLSLVKDSIEMLSISLSIATFLGLMETLEEIKEKITSGEQ